MCVLGSTLLASAMALVLLAAWLRSAVMIKDSKVVDAVVDAALEVKAANHAAAAVGRLGAKCDFTLMMKEMAMRMRATSRQ